MKQEYEGLGMGMSFTSSGLAGTRASAQPWGCRNAWNQPVFTPTFDASRRVRREEGRAEQGTRLKDCDNPLAKKAPAVQGASSPGGPG